jgi:hypothetical protein
LFFGVREIQDLATRTFFETFIETRMAEEGLDMAYRRKRGMN